LHLLPRRHAARRCPTRPHRRQRAAGRRQRAAGRRRRPSVSSSSELILPLDERVTMTETLPTSTTYAVIGAGIHGLSTAWHLAMELEARGSGSGKDIVVLDKTGPGAGASGIACGCVRNLYMTEPLHAILRHSVDVWTYDPVAFGFQQVGYVGVDEEARVADYERVWKSQNAAGYPSDLHVGEDARRFVRDLWPDFNTARVGLALHEKVSGYAGTRQAIAGLA